MRAVLCWGGKKLRKRSLSLPQKWDLTLKRQQPPWSIFHCRLPAAALSPRTPPFPSILLSAVTDLEKCLLHWITQTLCLQAHLPFRYVLLHNCIATDSWPQENTHTPTQDSRLLCVHIFMELKHTRPGNKAARVRFGLEWGAGSLSEPDSGFNGICCFEIS